MNLTFHVAERADKRQGLYTLWEVEARLDYELIWSSIIWARSESEARSGAKQAFTGRVRDLLRDGLVTEPEF
jgi:hypothetical protein